MRKLSLALYQPLHVSLVLKWMPALLLLLLLGVEGLSWATLRSHFAQNSVALAAHAAAATPPPVETPDDSTLERHQRMATLIGSLQSDPLGHLDQLAAHLPQDVAILSIDTDGATSGSFTLEIEAKDAAAVYAFWVQLKHTPSVQDAALLERKHQNGPLPDLQRAWFSVKWAQ